MISDILHATARMGANFWTNGQLMVMDSSDGKIDIHGIWNSYLDVTVTVTVRKKEHEDFNMSTALEFHSIAGKISMFLHPN